MVLLLSLFSQQALSYDFYWSGNYSAEANFFSGVDLGNSSDGSKSYINHHLFLQPEVILFSGLSVKGALDAINGGADTLPSSQRVGQILGSRLVGSDLVQDQNPIFVDRIMERNRGLNISEAYLEYSHTNGIFMVGRFPLHFGLGAFYNKGHKVFDHWFTNRDGLAYDFHFGNLYFKPMFSFITDSLSTNDRTITEYGLEFHFKIEDTGLDLGIMILQRSVSEGSASSTSKDSINSTDSINSIDSMDSINPVHSIPGVTQGSSNPLFVSLFYQRTGQRYSYGFEGFFQTGDIGRDESGNSISLKGTGLAFESEFKSGKWDIKGKAGYAMGDDTSSTNSYSAVAFNRNYNLGLILFNHPLSAGAFDPTQTNAKGRVGGVDPTNFTANEAVDTDTISNTTYFSPSVNYNFNETWSWTTILVFAWLQETKILENSKVSSYEVSSYLGSEVDLTLTYKPTKNIICSGTLGFLFPGPAFEGDGSLKAESVFASTMRLGITF